MPTYEYLCKSCGERLEVQQAFTDDALTECPRCAGRLRKVFGNVGITFKGSGFYKTDSRSGSSASSSSSSSKESSSKDSSSSDGSSGSGSKGSEGGTSSGGGGDAGSGASRSGDKASTSAPST